VELAVAGHVRTGESKRLAKLRDRLLSGLLMELGSVGLFGGEWNYGSSIV
jgi:hypothetical protein